MIPLPQTVPASTPWNKGQLIGQKPPLKLREIWAIRIRLQLKEDPRELAMFNLAIDSKLRSCDLVHLRVRDVYHGHGIAPRAMVLQQKTQQPVQFEITEQTREALPLGLPTIIAIQTTIYFQVASVVPIIFQRDSMLESFTSGSR